MSASQPSPDRPSVPPPTPEEQEVDALVVAAVRCLRRNGCAATTVAGVLGEAGLSTRAFYRHFRSKDELFAAVLERDSIASRERMDLRLGAAPGPLEKLGAWVDEMLTLAYDPKRARRTRIFAETAVALRAVLPGPMAAIYAAPVDALERVLEDGRVAGVFPSAEPRADAASILALTWNLVEERFGGEGLDLAAARARLLGFALRALGADLRRARRTLRF